MSEKDFYLYIGGKPVKVSKEVYQEYYRGERKERYFMEDLKTERMKIDQETQSVTVIPSREDSYERLLETDKQFSMPCQPVEEEAILSVLLEKALRCLSAEEQELIYELYYLEKTEQEVGAIFRLSQAAIHKRKKKALERLRELLK